MIGMTLEELEAAVAALTARVAQIEVSTPTLEEQMFSLVIDDWSGNTTLTSPQRMTLMVAPWPVRILSVDLSFDYGNVTASNTNYWRAVLEKSEVGGAFPDITAKSTQATGGEANGSIIARRCWSFDSANWGNADIAKGQLLSLYWQEVGVPPALKLPMAVTVRYAAL
jgi:hypothetical protein